MTACRFLFAALHSQQMLLEVAFSHLLFMYECMESSVYIIQVNSSLCLSELVEYRGIPVSNALLLSS